MFTSSKTISFADTDMAGVAHFSRLLCLVEQVEHEWLLSLGFDLVEDVGWPRVALSVDFTHPAHFRDTVLIHITPDHDVGTSSLSYRFEMRGTAGEALICSGAITIVRRTRRGEKAPFTDAERTRLSA